MTPIKGHCPKCGPNIYANVVAAFDHSWDDEEASVWGSDTYRVMQCRGCERVYFQTSSRFSEDDPRGGPTITHWPSPERRSAPEWVIDLANVDLTLHSLLQQTYAAFNTDLRTLAAVGLRAVFDRSTEVLGVDSALTFAQKLESLVRGGNIGSEEQKALEALTDAGGAAIHRGWHPKQ